MGPYRTVLHEGLRDDLPRYLSRDVLLQLCSVLRTVVGRTVRTVWDALGSPYPLVSRSSHRSLRVGGSLEGRDIACRPLGEGAGRAAQEQFDVRVDSPQSS
jgi:hypothetical protein